MEGKGMDPDGLEGMGREGMGRDAMREDGTGGSSRIGNDIRSIRRQWV